VWSNAGYQQRYVLALASLAPYTGDYLRARLVFRADAVDQSSGVVIDDVQLHEEGSDPDADGIPGVLDELMSTGTDPYLTDTDGDGTFDGIELIDQTDPLNPAWYAGGPVLLPGGIQDFESGDGGSATGGDLWEHAVVIGGPGRAHSGSWALSTRGDGNYFSNAIEYLYLPRIDLVSAMNPTLAFRLWIAAGSGDGVRLEVETATGWISIAPVLGPYDGIAGGAPSWRTQGYRSNYVLVAFVLNPYVGSVISTRLVFRSDGIDQGAGAFIDDLGVFEESSDFDADGLTGVLGEISSRGTDPFVDDTDGDDDDDGPEIAAGRDPLDPADFIGGPVLQLGAHLTFESNGGGLVPQGVPSGLPVAGSLWERGIPMSGPGFAFSGTRVWATNLEGNYFDGAREVLHLPPIDLTGVIDPTLSFRLWSAAGTNDGVSLEVFLPGIGWGPVVPAFPARDGIDAGGRPAWRNQGGPGYVFAAASLQLYTNQLARVRFVFRSDAGDNAAGAYLDDVRIDLEASDPDADGLFGVITEHGDYGTDPYLFDTDGDGLGDGVEITAGSDPLDPESP
jgi:bacillopeptidase F